MGQDDLVAFARGSDGRWHHWGAVPSAPHTRGGASVKSLVAAILIVLMIAACTAASSTPAASETQAGSSSGSASGGSFESSSPGLSTPEPSPSSNLVVPHDDPGLEARLPDRFEAKTLFKLSVGPVSSAGNEGAEPVKALAKEIGDGTGNFSLAFANDPTALDANVFNYFALQIPGAPTAQLVDRYAALTVADTRGAESEQLTVAGKQVTHVTAPGNPIGDVWIYGIDDTMFGVQAHSPEKAAALLAQLP
jgi:hypothetical protein